MTGPEHYRKAEQEMQIAEQAEAESHLEVYSLAVAQVHATLAMAAAVGLNDHEGGMPPGDWSAWRAVAATPVDPTP